MRSAKLWMVMVVLLASPLALFGAGGTCPSGANYLSLSNPTGPLVTLSSFGVTSCYFIAASGSDSNNGTSESTPWLHAPGMAACTAACASVTPAAGEGFIFRGGDTWHFGNSSASPYTGGGWEWFTWSGTSSNYIYIGVDPSWYSGSSWARPILNADNPLSTSPVASCAYQVAHNPIDSQGPTNIVVDLNFLQYLIFDDFEMTGLCWNTNDNAGGTGGAYVKYSGSTAGIGNVSYIENNYLHGWTHTTAGGQAGANGFIGYSQNTGQIVRFNVVDGSDSDTISLAPLGENSDGWDIEYNVFRYFGGAGDIFQKTHLIHDNLFEYMAQNTDGSTHSDIAFAFGEYAGGSSSPNLFYNNIFRNVGPGFNGTAQFAGYGLTPDTPVGQTDYIFNNVSHDENTGGSSNWGAICDNGAAPCGSIVLFNNTQEAGLPGVTGYIWGSSQSMGLTTSVNNHWITNNGTGTSAAFDWTGGSSVTESTSVYQTLSTANGQGYTSASDFSPTSSSGATVTASGTNETTGYCADSVLHNTAAEAACKEGITGVSYNQTNHTVVYPAFPATPRPATGAWEVGAYQFGGASAVNPPTSLTATPH
ncbi:MAG TPA: hypothetical protein VGY31_15155 [Terriglobia bacterium]|nr:hypothetical protein [Terriglobia bacterium]